MKTTLKRTDIGLSSAQVALMVKIDWTDAPVVKISARQQFSMTASRVAVLRDAYTVLADTAITVAEHSLLLFVRSGLPGYYYIVSVNTLTSRFACTCPAKHSPRRQDRTGLGCYCHHIEEGQNFLIAREAARHARLVEARRHEEELVAASVAVEAARATISPKDPMPVNCSDVECRALAPLVAA
ncbi:MAG: hypothetical protein H0W02_10295 [Ktedonobacteraceae bacterium]|nr:hypothetical protein [Ktedonobacteraceae bacterium]